MVEASTIADVLEETKIPEKKIIDDALLAELDKALLPKLLDHSLSQIQNYYQANNHDAFVIAYTNLLTKLRKAYTIL